MKLQVIEISHKKFQDFVENFYGKKTFLQSSNFFKFRETLNEKNFYYGIYKNKELMGIAGIQKIKTKFKTFLHCPHGPLLKEESMLFPFISEYKNIGKKEQCDFVRISPLLPSNQNIKNTFKKAGFINAAIHLVNPEKTWVLDITQSEEDILKNMKKTTRYEIRRREKCKIEVVQGNTKKDLDLFWELHMETVKRQKFIPFSKNSTQIELDVFKNNIQIFSGKIDETFYSSNIIIFDKEAAYYHQAASIYSKFPVSHAILWEAIKEAKKRECKTFNFWGISEESNKNHPWYGLSKFKRGFGGKEENYLHCQDFPITSKYWINYAIEKYRRWKRGY